MNMCTAKISNLIDYDMKILLSLDPYEFLPSLLVLKSKVRDCLITKIMFKWANIHMTSRVVESKLIQHAAAGSPHMHKQLFTFSSVINTHFFLFHSDR